ncbi:hypothetical protein ASD11_14095 [Aeromicrobium sp. Root495]|nr:hypothetical protein ASD11_14095 [Aeromicrobium sp. Root495]
MGNFLGRNFGDDLMLKGLLEEGSSDHRVVLCQVMPESDGGLPAAVDVSPMGLRTLMSQAGSARVLVLAGGTHHQYLRSHPRLAQYKVLVKWLVVYLIMRLRGVRLEMRAVGVGPFESVLSRLLARACLRLQSAVTVRDPSSLELLRGWGTPVEMEVDLAVPYLTGWSDRRSSGVESPPAPYTVLAPAFANFDQEWWIDQVNLHVPSGQAVVLFASGRQSSGSDDEINRALAERLSSSYPCTFVDFTGDTEEALQLLAGATRIIAARYHVVLTARLLGRDLIADIYHPKVNDALAFEAI